MAYKNDLSVELENLVFNDPATAAPQILDLLHRLLSERHAYRIILEPVAYGRVTDLEKIRFHARSVCEDFTLPTK